jgi:hypothetical protein
MTKNIRLMGLLALLSLSGPAIAEENFLEWALNFSRTKEVKPVTDKTYRAECGDCHFAYQPGLLPAQSWEKLDRKSVV